MHHFLKTFNISQALQHKHVLRILHSILSLPKLIWQRLLWNRCQSYVVTSCTLEDSNLRCDVALLGEYCLLLHGQSSCPFLQQFIVLVPLDSWRRRQNDPLQCKELLTLWCSITSQTVCTFSNTALRTSNLSSKFRFKAWHATQPWSSIPKLTLLWWPETLLSQNSSLIAHNDFNVCDTYVWIGNTNNYSWKEVSRYIAISGEWMHPDTTRKSGVGTFPAPSPQHG